MKKAIRDVGGDRAVTYLSFSRVLGAAARLRIVPRLLAMMTVAAHVDATTKYATLCSVRAC